MNDNAPPSAWACVQLDLPGTAPEPLRVTLARKAAEPLKPQAPQERPPAGGLFGDCSPQLFDR